MARKLTSAEIKELRRKNAQAQKYKKAFGDSYGVEAIQNAVKEHPGKYDTLAQEALSELEKEGVPKELVDKARNEVAWRNYAKDAKGPVNLETLQKAAEVFNLTPDDVARIYAGDLHVGKGYDKYTNDKETAFKNFLDKRFGTNVTDFQQIQEGQENNPFATLYRLMSSSSGSNVTKEQEQAAQKLNKIVQEVNPYQINAMQAGSPAALQGSPQVGSALPTAGQLATSQSQALLQELVNRFSAQTPPEPVEFTPQKYPEGATDAQRTEIDKVNKGEKARIDTLNANAQKDFTLRQRRNEAISQGLSQVGGHAISALSQGPEGIPTFGDPNAPGALGSYSRLVNAIRPERTGFQNFASSISRAAPAATSAALGQAGQYAFGPLGGTVGALAGSGLGYLGQLGLQKFAQPAPEFSPIGDLLAGRQRGIFDPGTRGLAGLISGETPTSQLGSLFGLLSPRAANTRFGRLRQSLGGGVRNVGRFIGAPGRAGQLGSILQAAQLLPQFGQDVYNIGEGLGINSILRGIGRRLGIINQDPYANISGLSSGESMAAGVLPSAYQFLVPGLQQEANRFLGRNVPAMDIVGNLDQQAIAALGPQIASQNITASKIAGKSQQLGLKQRTQAATGAAQNIANQLAAQRQNQQFERAVKTGTLKNVEEVERARMMAERNRLSAQEIASGRPSIIQPQLESVKALSGLPEFLAGVAQPVQQFTAPLVLEAVKQKLTPSRESV